MDQLTGSAYGRNHPGGGWGLSRSPEDEKDECRLNGLGLAELKNWGAKKPGSGFSTVSRSCKESSGNKTRQGEWRVLYETVTRKLKCWKVWICSDFKIYHLSLKRLLAKSHRRWGGDGGEGFIPIDFNRYFGVKLLLGGLCNYVNLSHKVIIWCIKIEPLKAIFECK